MTILDIPPQRNWLNNLKPRKYAAYNYLPPVGLAKGIARLESFFLWTPHITCSGFVSLTRAFTKKIRVGRTPTGGRNELSRNREEITKLKIGNALRKKDRPAKTAQKKEDWCLSITSPAKESTCGACPGLQKTGSLFLRWITPFDRASQAFFKLVIEFIRIFKPLPMVFEEILMTRGKVDDVKTVSFPEKPVGEPYNHRDCQNRWRPRPVVTEEIRKRNSKENHVELKGSHKEETKIIDEILCRSPIVVPVIVPMFQYYRFVITDKGAICSGSAVIPLKLFLLFCLELFIKFSFSQFLFRHESSFQIGGIPQKGSFFHPKGDGGVAYGFC